MVLPERGFSLFWKAPIAQWAKKALLAFLMASSTALVAERSHGHQYPRHLTLSFGRSDHDWSARVQTGIEETGLEGKTIRTSVKE